MIHIFDYEQGSPEWFGIRRGIPTASKFATVMAKGEGKTRRDYMLTLIGELLTNESEDDYTNAHMERGKAMEDEARQAYAFISDAEPQRVGFIRKDEPACGCSPDSLIGDKGMLEVKTKLPKLQIDVILRDRLPPEHVAQCQGALWVADREWLDFVSYWPKLPLFVKRVYRDEAYISNLAVEVAQFNADMIALIERIQPMKAAA